MNLLAYMMRNSSAILTRLLEHIQIVGLAIGVAIAIGVPVGILVNYVKSLKMPILGSVNVLQTIPSIALLGMLVPFLGIGAQPAIFMVVVYSLLPIVKNTATGLENIDPETIEAAKGIGMTEFQILMKVKMPLALPVIMAGIRISSVTAVGTATIAAFIGGGGLGHIIYRGLRVININLVLSGAIPACLLAVVIDWLGGFVERLVTPICFKENSKQFNL